MIIQATRGFPTRMTDKRKSKYPNLSNTTIGSNNIPTETKKRTAKASRIGSASAAAW
jgi:hypothetical protein